MESCTALVEHHHGTLLLRWTKGLQVLASEAPAVHPQPVGVPLPAVAMARAR